MAEPISYEIPGQDPEQNRREHAWAELDQLVVLLHEHQVLRLACDSTAALADVARIVTSEIDTEDGKHVIENLYVLTRVLARIEPQKLERVAEAATHGFEQMQHTTTGEKPYPPGLSGAFSMLRDEELWQMLGPALEGLKAFTDYLQHRK